MNLVGELSLPQRLNTLSKLAPHEPNLLTRHNLIEKLSQPSRFLPPLGIEIETFPFNTPWNRRKTQELTRSGIPVDYKDTHSGTIFRYKWEAALHVSENSHIPLMREIQQIHKRNIIRLPRNRFNHEVESYPIHLNIGIKGFENFSKFLMYSNARIFARMLEGTAWATSSERILEPIHANDNELSGSWSNKGREQGVSFKTSASTGTTMDVTEIATMELWGMEGYLNLPKLCHTAQLIGASLIPYSLLLIEQKNEVERSMESGNLGNVNEILNSVLPYEDKEINVKLILEWLNLKRNVKNIFERYDLDDPATKYTIESFKKLAHRIQPVTHFLRRPTPSDFSQEMRQLLTSHRQIITNILE